MSDIGGEVGRVLHAPFDIAAQASRSVRGLRALGVTANLYAPAHAFGYDPPDFSPPPSRLQQLRLIRQLARRHDVFHFHFGATFSPRFHLLDARFLRATGRRVVAEFHGSDVRIPSIQAAHSPFYVPLEGEDDERALHLIKRWTEITDGYAIAPNASLAPFLEPHFDHIAYVGGRVDVGGSPARPPDPSAAGPLVVVHAPSDPRAKGTAFLRRAVELVDGLEYVEVSGRSHDEVRAALGRADLVVDQLCFGIHGVLALEAMAMAKPVVCDLAPWFSERLPEGCPIILADPVTIADVLAAWRDRRPELHRVGLDSRAWVERNYDLGVVAQRLVAAYAQLPTA